ncbi:hypothetical protein JRO89_XS04G0232900 [Xanthoceras sorbifolium]|uniref:CRC domain-containing protein n=1 Tax=Xanthoceras sorbifolium TaxID=99658 RepID=A0ABQ8I6W0_9ROSI|nr:hypothetical protein JRO89_XS04G0232900 [Xanthoceras sorbifolium]
MGEGDGGEFPPKKVQSETQGTAVDFPAKKLARQLDFTGGIAGTVVLPEHPQPQAVTAKPQSQPHPQPQPQVVGLPPVPPPQSTQPSVRVVKPESPKSRSRPNAEVKEGTPKKQKQCNCKHSRCLKLYCECFASGIYCDGCNCVNCCNNVENEAARREAVEATLERNPNAFRPKIASSPHGTRDSRAANAAITGAIGSSGFASPPVSKKRKGQDIFFGSTAKDPSLHRLGHFQQANHVRASASSPSLSSVPVVRATSTASSGPSKFTYRSLLADLVHPQDVKELCSVLVVLTGEAAKTLADQQNAREKQAEDQRATSVASSTQDRLQSPKDSEAEKTVNDDCSSANQADKVAPDDSSSDGADVPKGRPMSPGTLALMCDEQDAMFMAASSPNSLTGQGCNTSSQVPYGQGLTEVYAEQERIVLMKFRDCLNKLITFGEIKGKFLTFLFLETKYSSIARTELGNQKDPLINGIANGRTETGNPQAPVYNGVSKAFGAHTLAPPTAKTSEMVTAVVATYNRDLIKNPVFTGDRDTESKTENKM